MKDNTKRNSLIFNLWYSKKLSYRQIAEMKFESRLSLRRIRNIVYGGLGRIRSEHQRKIYGIFRMKFLELEDVDRAIRYAHANQPPRSYSEAAIKKIINRVLNEKKNKQAVITKTMTKRYFKDKIHGYTAQACSKQAAWMLIRNVCRETGRQVPTMDQIREITNSPGKAL